MPCCLKWPCLWSALWTALSLHLVGACHMGVIPLPQEGRTHACTRLLMGTHARVHTSPYGNIHTHFHTSPYGDTLTSPYGDTLMCAHVSLWEHTLSHVSLRGHTHVCSLLMGTQHTCVLIASRPCPAWTHTQTHTSLRSTDPASLGLELPFHLGASPRLQSPSWLWLPTPLAAPAPPGPGVSPDSSPPGLPCLFLLFESIFVRSNYEVQ